MKKIINYALCIMGGALIASCSSDDAVQVLYDTPMTISAGVNDLSTRAGYDSETDLQGSAFGLFLSTPDATAGETNYDKYNTKNLKFTYSSGWSIASDGQWENQPTKQLLWKSSESAVNYIAYMPFDKDMTLTSGKDGTEAAPESYTFSVQKEQNDAANVKTSDFLYYSATSVKQPNGGTSIDIPFSHKMSKLKLVLTEGTELAALENNFDITSVTLSQAQINATINLSTGVAAAASTATKENITLYKTGSETDETTKVATYNYECIIAPQSSLQLVINIKGNDNNTYTFTGSTTGETFESGKQYTLNLTVGRDKVVAGSFTASEWDTNTTGGDLTTE